jgi:chromosome segregation ATPase
MKCSIASWVWLALCAVARGNVANAASRHPVEKVIGLLKDLMAQANKESQEEEYLYTKFEHWCTGSQKTLSEAITAEKEDIDKLEDMIASKTEELEVLTKQIGALADQLAELDGQNAKAIALREKENNLYKFEEKQLKDTIDGVAGALALLEGAQQSTASAALIAKARASVHAVMALVEVHTTEEQQRTLAGFAAPDGGAPNPTPEERVDKLKALGDRDEHVKKYAFKSEAVIELLKQLKKKFEADLLAAVKAETNAENAHKLAMSARADEITATTKAKGNKESAKGEAKSAKDKADEDLASTQADLAADSALLSQTEQKCSTKEAQWAERSKTREQELSAMEAAIKILAEVTGVQTEAPENPVPPPSPLSFLQTGGSGPSAGERALRLLRKAAQEAKSKTLERFAQEVSAHLDGPFDEVNNMIEKMIYRLMDEQKDEDEHKHWCDLEINKTDASLADKADKIAELQAKIDASEAYTQQLAEEIMAANEMVAKIEMHMKESTDIREIGKKENAVAVKDAQDAQTAIANAIAVLETHYKESGMIAKESWELVQTRRAGEPAELPPTPSTWDASYTGVTDPMEPGSGVIAVLQKTNENFAKMEADTRAQEASDLHFYE